MEFPFGHHHRHHHRGDDEEERQPEFEPHPPVHHRRGDGEEWRSEFEPPPPHHPRRGDGEEEWRPEFESPPPVHYGRPEGQYDRHDYPPVEHVSHEVHRPPLAHGNAEEGHYGRPYKGYGGAEGGAADRVPTVRVFTRAEENYSLSIRDGAVILARSDPNDEFQHWIKDMKYSTRVKDEEGFPSFALVNKATGQALKHSIGATHPVRLIPYKPDYLDESVLWTESNDLGDGFRCIRMVNNIRLNFDAFHGDEDHGGVHDGTTLVLWEWLKGNNQRWKIVPH